MHCIKKYLWVLTVCFYALLTGTGCNNTKTPETQSSVVAEVINTAEKIEDSVGTEEGYNYLDSALGNFHLSPIDKYLTYSFRYNHFYVIKHNYQKATAYADSMLQLVSTEPKSWDTFYIFKAYMLKGNAAYAGEQFNTAFSYYEKAKELAMNSKSPCREYMYFHRIAMAVFREEKYLESARMFRLAYKRSELCDLHNIERFFRQQEILSNTGIAYSKANMPDSSLYFYKATLQFIQTNKGQFPAENARWNEAISVVFGNMGSAYTQLKLLDSAEIYFRKSILLNEQYTKNERDRQFNLLKLAKLYIGKSKNPEALNVLHKYDSLDVINRPERTEEDNLEFDFRRTEVYSAFYSGIGDHKTAIEYLKKHDSVREKKWKITNTILKNDLQNGIENITNEKQIVSLEKDVQIKKQQNIILVLTILLSAGGIIFIYRILKKYSLRNRKLEQANENILRQSAEKEALLQQKIREDELNFMALIENTDDFLWSVDTEFNLLAFNKAYKEYFHSVYAKHPKIGGTEIVKEYSPVNYEKLVEGYRTILAGQPYEIVGKGIPAKGVTPDIEVRFKPIMDANGKIKGVSCFRRDITDYVQLVRTLEKNNKQLKKIAWVQSHKLRGPLSTLMAIAMYLEEEGTAGEQNEEIMQSLKEKLDEMDQIIHEIVSMAE
ncbi:MAG: PAS domain S-box protein [Taibaiella sp.]|nr:PAS domain S-box protein [Taibaiella sp.]